MSGFALLRKGSTSQDCNNDIVIALFDKKNMKETVTISIHTYQLILFYKNNLCMRKFLTYENGDFIAYTGTMIHNGSTSIDALSFIYSFYLEYNKLPDSAGFIGSFCLMIVCRGSLILWASPDGMYNVYMNHDKSIVSSSLIACRCLSGAAELLPHESIEYVFFGTFYGNQTPISGISTLPCEKSLLLTRRELISEEAAGWDCTVPIYRNSKDTIDALLLLFENVVQSFGQKLACPITGGFDSRLICAALRKLCISPEFCFTLHKDHQEDISIAHKIADILGWNWVTLDNTFPSMYLLDNIVRQYVLFDGLGIGGIFQYFSGLDYFEKISDELLLLDGSGGEVFRNPYGLPLGGGKTSGYLAITHLKYISDVCSIRINFDNFLSAFESKLKYSLGVSGYKLSRIDIERAYPEFRMKNWLKLHVSCASQFTDVLVPFMSNQITCLSNQIPANQKILGMYEARLIERLAPEIAIVTSNYGYNFKDELNYYKYVEELVKVHVPKKWIRFLKQMAGSRTIDEGRLPFYSKSSYSIEVKKACELVYEQLKVERIVGQFLDVEKLTKADQISRATTLDMLVSNIAFL